MTKENYNKDKIFTRGRTFVGTVISAKIPKTCTVEWERKIALPKYERFEKRRTKVQAHDPLNAKKGDIVRIEECRPLSKTKNFIVKEIIGEDIEFKEKEDSREESKEVIKNKLREKNETDKS